MWLSILIVFLVVAVVIIIELLLIHFENKEREWEKYDQKRRNAILFAIAKKFGVTEADVQEQMGIMNENRNRNCIKKGDK